jgi:hypothetical protein
LSAKCAISAVFDIAFAIEPPTCCGVRAISWVRRYEIQLIIQTRKSA